MLGAFEHKVLFVQDEIRLTKENGLFRQTIHINGSDQLAEVVKLGMMSLYFKTDDGKFGQAIKQDNQWTFLSLNDANSKQALNQLFESMKKQIRVGYFQLPKVNQ